MMKTNEIKKDAGVKRKNNLSVLWILIGFLAVITVIQFITTGKTTMIGPVNLANVLGQVAAPIIMTMGMTLVMIAGNIDLSVGMLTSFVVIFTAKSYMDWDYPLAASIILAIVFAVLMSIGMGLVISRLKVESFIITLGGMMMFRGIALLICRSQEISMQGAMDPLKVSILPEGLKDAEGLAIGIPRYVLFFIVATVIIWFILKYTKYGRNIYAVGANREAAYLAGINVKNVIMSTYALNGLLVGIGAICLLSRVNTAIITTGANLEIDVIAAAVVGGIAMSGGKGTAWGACLGAILLGFIGNGMNILRLQAEWQYVAKGAIIIAAVSAGAIGATIQARNQLRQQRKEGVQETLAASNE